MKSWWKELWECERRTQPAATEIRPILSSEEPAPMALWIEPLEERVMVGLIWGQ